MGGTSTGVLCNLAEVTKEKKVSYCSELYVSIWHNAVSQAQNITHGRAGVKSPCKESYDHLNESCRFRFLHTRLVARPQRRNSGAPTAHARLLLI
jgi:hypothetical protein